MTSLLLAGATGFLLGLRHATDADHVVAVSTIVARTRRASTAWLVGAAWGLGHTVTLSLAGGAMLWAREAAPAPVGLAFEFLVGAMLVWLGVGALTDRGAVQVHEHPHDHAAAGDHGHHLGAEATAHDRAWHAQAQSCPQGAHSHPHLHLPEVSALALDGGARRLARSFAVGLVHGLAGSSAIALAALAAMPGFAAALGYLLVFGVGTLAGMSLVTAVFAYPVIRWAGVEAMRRWLAPASGLASVGLGLVMMYHIGFIEGLLR